MLFNSIQFLLVFLPVTLTGYYWLHFKGCSRSSFIWLICASMVFYAYWSIEYLALLVVLMFLNFAIGILVASSKGRMWLWIGIVVDLSVLAYFKYANFFMTTISGLVGTHWNPLDIALPLGISFFTFQKIAYLVDSYRGIKIDRDPIRFTLFVLFFPQLIAGPIVHYSQLMPQLQEIERGRRVSWALVGVGLFLFCLGMCKKVLIADTIAPIVDQLFSSARHLGAWEAWTAALGYSLQLYFDFSGYSDMAIGLALMVGIKLPINFNAPYHASNIADFWRRWHMTLGAFLRDYVYVPLGGNRHGMRSMLLATCITFLIGGLWHGAGWTYILWGLGHGLGICIYRLWSKFGLKINSSVACMITFVFVMLLWVMFRSQSVGDAVEIYKGMAGIKGFELPPWLGITSTQTRLMLGDAGIELPLFMLVLIGIWWSKPVTNRMVSISPTFSYLIATICMLGLTLTKIGAASSFLYYAF